MTESDLTTYTIEIAEGMRPEFVSKPNILVLSDKMEKNGVQWWAGGYADQPSLLMMEIDLARNSAETWRARAIQKLTRREARK